MRNRESHAVESRFFNPTTLLVAVIVIGCMGIAAMLMPAGATSGASTASAASHAAIGDGPGYLPAQYVNQAKEIEPMPATF
jgi:hypothetical protein